MLEKLERSDVMIRNINRQLMVMWINADLVNRADQDVRKSIVLYDEDKMFKAAIGPGHFAAAQLQEGNAIIQDALHNVGVRYWSVGVR